MWDKFLKDSYETLPEFMISEIKQLPSLKEEKTNVNSNSDLTILKRNIVYIHCNGIWPVNTITKVLLAHDIPDSEMPIFQMSKY